MKNIICIILATSLIACGEKGTNGKRTEDGKAKQAQIATKMNEYEEAIAEIKKASLNFLAGIKNMEITSRRGRPDYIDYKSREWKRKGYIEQVGQVYAKMKKEGLISSEEYEMKMLNLREEAKDLTSPDY